MPLAAGDQLGHYEVLSLLGKGGMGEVYRARDTQLKRDVALKVLPAVFSADPERLARFQREAEVLASLDHPNIGHIHGMVQSEQNWALVLALIEGPTLDDHIKQGAVPADEAVAIAKQVIDALEYAHDHGVIHRDLKPANIKITPDGVVKVLDFGLAKALDQRSATSFDPENSPTLTMGATQAGVIMGTAAYMSPEQAVGKGADRRSDIFSFGVVLYEMLTGQRPFRGESVGDTLAAVVKDAPDWSALPAATPAYLRKLLERLLAKDRKQRLQAIGEARIALAQPQEQEITTPQAPPVPQKRSGLPWAVAALALAGAATLGYTHYREQPPQLVKLEFPPPEKGTIIQDNGPPAVSPDGRRVAFRAVVDGKAMLWVRDLDSLVTRVLPGTERGSVPFWAPDSRNLGFAVPGKLMKIDVTGGPAITIANVTSSVRGGTWNRDDVILFAPNAGAVMRVPAAGGTATQATELDASRMETSHREPRFLPDGRHYLYTGVSSNAEQTAILVGDLESPKEHKLVVQAASNGEYVWPGYLLFVRDRTLMAQPFDASKLAATGDARPIAEQVDVFGTYGYFAASQTGVLAYTSGGLGAGTVQISWRDRSGKVVGTVGKPVDVNNVRLSPDGKMVATDRLDAGANNRDIWLHDLARGTEQRLTFNGDNASPVWSPDGLRIAFRRNPDGKVLARSADGTGAEEVLEAANKMPMDWTRDGGFLLSATPSSNPKTSNDIWALPLSQKDPKPLPLRQTEFQEWYARVSPDGRWMAYLSTESKRSEVYVVGFPALNGKWQISPNGGRFPVWSRDGRELYFISAEDKLMAVRITPGAQFQPGIPQPLFDVRFANVNSSYDVSADGRFLIPTPLEQSASVPMTVVLNWQAMLK